VQATPPSPELEALLRANGTLDQLAAKLNAAREKGFFAPGDALSDRKGSSGMAQSFSAEEPDTFRVIVILADFDDKPASGGLIYGLKEDFEQLLFSFDNYDTHYSMSEFYRDNSYGGFIMIGDVVGWYRMPEDYAYYVNANYGFSSYPTNAQHLAEDALLMADDDVDFSLYDNDGNGYIDGVFIIHSGLGAEQTGSDYDIWSHNSGLHSSLYLDGVTATQYSMEPEENSSSGLVTMGVFAHEYGHTLGLPDLYDTDYSTDGIGYWSIMAGGSWGSNGARPSYFDAWCKYQLGFVEPTNIISNQLDVAIATSYYNPVLYRVWQDGIVGQQYFLVENRRKIGYDINAPGSGLIIYHVDESMWSNDDEWHRLVNVEQADGRYDLENDVNNGDGSDPWGTETATHFDDLSVPNSRAYSGAQTLVAVWNISDVDSMMYANFDIDYSHARFTMTDMAIDDNAGGDGDGTFEPGETIELTFALSNAWLGATNVTAVLSAANNDITFPTGSVNIGTVAGSGGTGDNYLQPLQFTIPIDFEPCIDSFSLDITTDNPLDETHFGLEIHLGGAEILVVDDDNGDDYQSSVTAPLLANGKPYDLYDKSTEGSPSGALLNEYTTVIWLTGASRSGILSSADITAMETYLDNGGNLFLTGQSIVKQLDSDDPAFLNNYLRVEYAADLFYPLHLGVTGSILGDGLKIRWANTSDQTDPQTMNVINGSEANFTANGTPSVITYGGAYNLVLMSFGFEAISSDYVNQGYATSQDVMDRILDFLSGHIVSFNPTASGATLLDEVSLDNVIDHTPEFSWQVTDTTGIGTVSFEVTVGTGTACYNDDNRWDPGVISSTDTSVVYAGDPLEDGSSYVFAVRVNNSVTWSEWMSQEFHMNGRPQPGNLIVPINDELVSTTTPLLKVVNFEDSEADALLYYFEVYSDHEMTNMVASASDVVEQSAATGWTVDIPLTEDEQFFWRVRAYDGYEYSDWSDTASFWVNAVNQAPQAFSLFSPVNGDTVLVSQPLMVWDEAIDSDPNDFVLYTLQVTTDSTFATYTEWDHLDQTSTYLPITLELNSVYFWRVKATDLAEAETYSSETFVMYTERTSCCQIMGDIDNSGAGPDISDLVYLVTYMFQGGTEPPCMDACDIDGSGAGPDISDLVYLVTYMFQSGPAPAACP